MKAARGTAHSGHPESHVRAGRISMSFVEPEGIEPIGGVDVGRSKRATNGAVRHARDDWLEGHPAVVGQRTVPARGIPAHWWRSLTNETSRATAGLRRHLRKLRSAGAVGA